jgi:hypothetical protein
VQSRAAFLHHMSMSTFPRPNKSFLSQKVLDFPPSRRKS